MTLLSLFTKLLISAILRVLHESRNCIKVSAPAKQKNALSGFTLLEMSIVLIIMAALLGGGISTFLAYVKKEGYQNTEQRLQRIEKELVNYRKAFNRLPCPADITRVIETAEFGKEANNKGSCTGGAIAANLSSSNMVSGMVPTKTLNLPDDYAFDSWGRRIRYSVDKRYTEDEAFNVYIDEDVMPSAFNLISHGSNGHGGYPRAGGMTMFNAGSTNAQELKNCACTSTATAGTFTGSYEAGAPTESSTTPTDKFDDIVLYKEPKMLGMVGQPVVACSDQPIGTVCPDGTVYAGLSPDGNVPMYTTRCDYGQSWDGSTCTGSRSSMAFDDGVSGLDNDTTLANCTNAAPNAFASCNSGKANSAFLATADSSTATGVQPHLAAQACESLVSSNGQSDWYLPALGELYILYQSYVIIGNFSNNIWYRSSSENGSSAGQAMRFNTGSMVGWAKHQGWYVRCVRR